MREAVLVGALSLLFAAAAFVAATLQKDRYTAEANLVFRGRTFAESIPGEIRVPSLETTPSPETTKALLSLPVIAKRTADDLPGDLSGSEIADKVDLQMHPGSELVTLRATDHNPNSAAAIANAYVKEAIAFDRSVSRRVVRDAIEARGGGEAADNSQRKGEGERILRHLRSRLRTSEVLQMGDLEEVEPATAPETPSSPHVATDVLFGLLVGMCVGSAVVALTRAKERIDDARRFEAEIGAPIIGAFTELAPRPHDCDLTDYVQLPPEIVAMLWARLRYYEPEEDRHVLLVISAARAEGKTTLSRNLVAVANAAGIKSTLIEPGRLQAAVGSVIDELAGDGYDLVVLDGCAASDDAAPDRIGVDGVIVIGRIGRATTGRTRALRKRLRNVDAPVLGAVVNFVSPEDPQAKPFAEHRADAPKLKVGT